MGYYKLFIYTLSIILTAGSTDVAETGVMRTRDVPSQEFNSIIDGLKYTGKQVVEVIIPEEPHVKDLSLARFNYKKGIELFNYMDYDAAVVKFKRANEIFYTSLTDEQVVHQLLDSLFHLGAIYTFSGNNSAAEKTFLSILEISPDFKPDEKRFPPRITDRFKEVKNRHTLHEHVVTICSPEHDVVLDGSTMLNPPVTLSLRQGIHTLSSSSGYRAIFRVDRTVLIYAGRIPGGGNSYPEQELAGLLNNCPLKEIIMVSKPGEELVIHHYNNTTVEDNPIQPMAQKEIKKPFYKKWWFWTGAGLIAGGGAGIYFATESHRKPEEGNSIVIKW